MLIQQNLRQTVRTDDIFGFSGVENPHPLFFPEFIRPREGQGAGAAPRGGVQGPVEENGGRALCRGL